MRTAASMSGRRRGAAKRLLFPAALGLMVLGYLGRELSLEGGEPTLVDVTRSEPWPGVELLRGHIRAGQVPRGELVALFVDPTRARVELRLTEGAPLESVREDAWAVINAGYFTETGAPTGLLRSRGETQHPFVPRGGAAGSGVLALVEDEVRLWRRSKVDRARVESAELALQAGPRIIEPDGTPGIRRSDGMRASRTVAGRDGRGRLALVVAYAGGAAAGRGPTLFEMQALLGAEGLGAIDPELVLEAALNLDGGPSTGILLADPASLELSPLNRPASALWIGAPR